MPLYEYICNETGETIELIRPMAQADDPVADPDGKGRAFVRTISAVSARSGAAAPAPSLPVAAPGCCPCGKPGGGCAG